MSVFLDIPENNIIYKGDFFFLIYDKYPVSPGHILIISNEIREDYFTLKENERIELTNLILIAKSLIEDKFTPNGYNIGMNCGQTAGQTVMHFHCHVIPRYDGDMKNPSGGIRHCVEGKGYY